jgi:hypothetical protein
LINLDVASGAHGVETDEEDTDHDTLLRHLMDGQYSNPIRIVSFNTGAA